MDEATKEAGVPIKEAGKPYAPPIEVGNQAVRMTENEGLNMHRQPQSEPQQSTPSTGLQIGQNPNTLSRREFLAGAAAAVAGTTAFGALATSSPENRSGVMGFLSRIPVLGSFAKFEPKTTTATDPSNPETAPQIATTSPETNNLAENNPVSVQQVSK